MHENIFRKILLYIGFVVFFNHSPVLYCQTIIFNYPNQQYFYEAYLQQNATYQTFSVKPVLEFELPDHLNYDSAFNRHFGYKYADTAIKRSWIHRKIFKENLISIKDKNFNLNINPIVDMQIGQNRVTSKKTFTNTRGIALEAHITKNVAIYSSIFENQAKFTNYVDTLIRQIHVAPGLGKVQPFKETGFDYAMSQAALNVKISKYNSVILGHGKLFTGNGYRSLLLSENAFNYPYLHLNNHFKRLKYNIIYAALQDLIHPHTYESGFVKKYNTTYWLEYTVHKKLSVSLFESIMWQALKEKKMKAYQWGYTNPLIGLHSATMGLNNKDNSIVGMNINAKPVKSVCVYSQLAIDQWHDHRIFSNTSFINRNAFQMGAKGYFNIKKFFVMLQAEYNQARPYTYSHADSMQNFTHYNQALAHPLGANFKEYIGIVFLQYKNWMLRTQYNIANYGMDEAKQHWGKNIFKNDKLATTQNENNALLQGLNTKLIFNDINISYIVNPASYMHFTLGYTYRSEKNTISNDVDKHIYFAFRTSLFNRYYDF